MTFRSSIKKELLRSALLKGTFLAGLGILCVSYAGIFFPPHLLQTWGLVLFLATSALICWGLIPYRRLKQLEIFPYKLVLKEALCLFSQDKILFTVPLESIEKILYLHHGKTYGIQFFFKKKTLKSRVVVHKEALKNIKFWNQLSKTTNCDLFIPYFTQRVYEELLYSPDCKMSCIFKIPTTP